MNNGYTTLTFDSFLCDLEVVNSSFDQGLLCIGYHGDNHNGSSIPKKAFEAAIPTMFNCPVVCRYIREENNLGGHDMEIMKQDDGEIKLIHATQPVGVVPESANWQWREITENDGTVREYLCTQVLIWKRQEAYEYIREHGIVGHSMEINILHSYKRSDGFKVFDEIEFTAFCLLGDGIKPCFESASLELFESNDIRDQINEMMNDFKQAFSLVNAASADDTYTPLSKGGNQEMNLDELMAKYGLSAEDVDFDTTCMTQEDIEARFSEIQAGKNADQAQTEPPASPEGAAFSLTAQQISDSLWEVLQKETYIDNWYGESREFYRYYLMDFDIEVFEAYVHDAQDGFMYGLSFAMNGDRAEIDFDSKKRKKIVYADYEDGAADTGEAVFSCESMAAQMRSAFDAVYSRLEEELTQLRTFKETTIQEKADQERQSALDEVFAKFTDLAGNQQFEELRQNNSTMTIDEIEEKCFAIKGRMTQTAHFSAANQQQEQPVRIPADAYTDTFSEKKAKDNEPYGGVFVEFGIGQ